MSQDEEEEADYEAEEDDEEEEESLEEAASRFNALDADLVEISVESLVGTVFEMRLSKRETIANIKLRLQRLEGIPRHQMHLLHRGRELPDPASLEDCQIETGANLRLILALRGGPINTRRVPLPQQQQQQHQQPKTIPDEIQQLMERNKDKLLDKIPPNGQVTVLLFREGDQVNLYHVMERPDGTFSPLSDADWNSSSGRSLKSLHKSEIDEEEESRLKENAVTMNKMTDLKNQMQRLSMTKKKSNPNRRCNKSGKPKTPETATTTQKRKNASLNGRSFNGVPLPPINNNANNENIDDFSSTTTSIFPLVAPPGGFSRQSSQFHRQHGVPEWLRRNNVNGSDNFKKVKNKQDENEDDIFKDADIVDLRDRRSRLISTDMSKLTEEATLNAVKVSPPRRKNHRRRLRSSTSVTTASDDIHEDEDIFSRNNAVLASRASEQLAAILSSSNGIDVEKSRANSASTTTSKKSRKVVGIDTEEAERILYGQHQQQQRQHHQHQRKSTPPKGPSFNAARPTSSSSRHRLMQQRRKKTPKPRCSETSCRKKLNITNGFPCRCQKVFCAKHRHPEIHNCTFDYKEEGRKLLERANPIVTFPKLPKI